MSWIGIEYQGSGICKAIFGVVISSLRTDTARSIGGSISVISYRTVGYSAEDLFPFRELKLIHAL